METMQQKGGKARWKNISKKKRSEIMKKVRRAAQQSPHTSYRDMNEIICADAKDVLFPDGVFITDPPYNQGYHYNKYSDRLDVSEYINLLMVIRRPAVVIHYPEETINILPHALGNCDEVISWVYPSNTGKQHRLISFWGIKPDFSRVKQPYKNLEDKRIQERIKNGNIGADMYDWIEMNQVKNVSAEKLDHPCQIPLELMRTIVEISTKPSDFVIDPFAGSGTTLLAAKQLGRAYFGVEIDDEYCEIIRGRLAQETLFV